MIHYHIKNIRGNKLGGNKLASFQDNNIKITTNTPPQRSVFLPINKEHPFKQTNTKETSNQQNEQQIAGQQIAGQQISGQQIAGQQIAGQQESRQQTTNIFSSQNNYFRQNGNTDDQDSRNQDSRNQDSRNQDSRNKNDWNQANHYIDSQQNDSHRNDSQRNDSPRNDSQRNERKHSIKTANDLERNNNIIILGGICVRYEDIINFVYQNKIKNEKYILINSFVKKNKDCKRLFTFTKDNAVLDNIANVLKFLKFLDSNISNHHTIESSDLIIINFYICYLEFILDYIKNYNFKSINELSKELNSRLLFREKQYISIVSCLSEAIPQDN